MGRTEGQGFSLVIVDHRQVERRDPALVRCLQACHVERAIPLLLLNLHGRRAPDGLAAEGIEFTAQLNKPIKSSQLLNTLVHVFAASAVQVRPASLYRARQRLLPGVLKDARAK